MNTPTLEELESIAPEISKRILIYQDVTASGENIYHLLHKRNYLYKPSSKDIPNSFKTRKTFKGAEKAALYLLINYKNIFN